MRAEGTRPLFSPFSKVANMSVMEVALKINDLELREQESLPNIVRAFIRQPLGPFLRTWHFQDMASDL